MNRRNNSYNIAIAGVSTALAMIFIVISIYFEPMTLSLNVLAALCILLPITKGSYKGAILAYVATSILAGVLNWVQAMPFILFFGSYTIVSQYLNSKKIKWYIEYPIKLIWFNIVWYILYNVVDLIIINFDKLGFTLEYIWIAVICSILFILYDLLMKKLFEFMNYYVNKMIK